MSGASVSSLGSTADSTHSSTQIPKGELSPGEDEGFEEHHHIQQGIFGVLYTVCKEQYMTSYGFAFFRLFVDFLQLWLLVVNPAYGFDIDASNSGWKAVSLINLTWFLQERGYAFFLVLLYILVGLLLVNVGLSVWVAHQFSNNSFDQVWPIMFLRWFGLIFYQVLDVTTLTLLLAALDCQYMGVPQELQFTSALFPGRECWAMPHIIHVAVSVVALVVFVVMAGAMVVSQMDLNPMTRHYMAIMHTGTEGYSFIIKTIATIASVMVNSTKWLSILYIACFASLLYLQCKWVPFTFAAPNYARGASYAAVLYSSVLLVALAFGSPKDPADRDVFSQNVTIALWVGLAPSALVGAIICYLRLRLLGPRVSDQFRHLESGTDTKSVYKFQDAREVEIVLRNTRHWLDEDTPDPECVKLGEAVIKAGLAQLSNNPQMFIMYSSFLIDVQGSYQSGYAQLQAAKKLSPVLLQRFAIFSREQEHIQKTSGANGGTGTAVDLVSYVEFQRSHRLVTRAHREALLAVKAFWGLLMHSNVNFVKLIRATNRIEATVRSAERAYRTVLSRHGSNVRIVRLYGRFLESVKFDPWAAAKWFAEAERLEEREEDAKEAMQLGVGIDLGGKGIVEGLACIFIDSQGIIQMASPEAHALLGYNKNELKGKDLGIILPPPFGEKHHVLVRSYIASGVSHGILDHTNEFVAISKSRQVVPVRLRVSKVSGLSEDSVFMGALESVPSPPNTARAWLLCGGGGAAVGGVVGFGITLIAADDRFLDWLGYDTAELVGQPVGGLLEDEEVLKSAFKQLWTLYQSRSSIKMAAAGGGRKAARRASQGVYGDREASTAGAEPAGAPAAWDGQLDAAAAAGSPGTLKVLTPAVTLSLGWKHKFSGVVHFKTHLRIGTIGTVKHLTVTMEADWKVAVPRPGGRGLPGTLAEMMLVSDNKGKVLFVTAALAAALGRAADSIRQGGIEMLLPEPYTSLHAPWLNALALPPGQAVAGGLDANTPAPPYSCRSGVAVSMCGYDEALGPVTRPFKLRMQQRLMPKLGQRVHVLALQALTREQAVSERRLKLTVDMDGGISAAEDAPAQLFGVDPQLLVGKALGELVDLFRADDALRTINDTVGEMAGGEGHKGSGSGSATKVAEDDLLAGVAGVFNAANNRQTTKMLLELARRSSEWEGISWRVGVTLPPDPAAAAELGALSRGLSPGDVAVASRLIGGRVVPAVMRVRLVKRDRASTSGDPVAAAAASSIATQGRPGTAAKWTISWDDGGVNAPAQNQQMPVPPPAPLVPPPAPAPPPVPLGGGSADVQQHQQAGSQSGADDARSGVSRSRLSVTSSAAAAADASRPMTPGSLVLGNDLDRPNSLRLAAAPLQDFSFRGGSTTTTSSGAAAGGQGPLAAAAAAVIASKGGVSPAAAVAADAAAGVQQQPSPDAALPQAPPPYPPSRGGAGAELHRLARPGSSSPRSHPSLAPPSAFGIGLDGGFHDGSITLPLSQKENERLRGGRPASGGATAHGQHSSGGHVLCVEVELWRADLLTGVVEVDERGRVLRIDPTDDMGQAALVLGAAKADLTGSNINSLLPLPPGGFLSLYNATGGDQGGGAPRPLRGALKSRKAHRDKAASPPCELLARHMGDGCVTSLRVQAVKRNGPYGTYYLMLRPAEPTPVQPGFVRWLTEGDTSGLAQRTQLGVKDPAAFAVAARAEASLKLGAGGSAAAAALSAAFGKSLPVGGGIGDHSRFHKSATDLGYTSTGGSVLPLRRAASVVLAQGPSSIPEEDPTTAAGTSASVPADAPAAPPPPPPPMLSGGLAAPIMRSSILRKPSRLAASAAAEAMAAASMAQQPASPRKVSSDQDSAYDPGMALSQPGAAAAAAAGPAGGNASSPRSGAGLVPGLTGADGGEGSVAATVMLLPGQTAGAPSGNDAEAAAAAAGTEVAALGADLSDNTNNSPFATSAKLAGKLAPKSKKDAKLAAASSWVMSGGKQHLAAPGEGGFPLLSAHSSRGQDEGSGGGGNDDDEEEEDDDDEEGNGGEGGDCMSSDDEAAAGAAYDQDDADAADARVRMGLLAAAAIPGGQHAGLGGGSHHGAAADSGLIPPEQQQLGQTWGPTAAGGRGGSSGRGAAGEDNSVTAVEDEAGAHVTNYSAGKRFKKIYKLLMSPQAQQPSRVLWFQALAVVVLLMAAHTATFAIMMMYLQVQAVQVTDLSAMGTAATRVHEVALYCRTLAELFDHRAQQKAALLNMSSHSHSNHTEPGPLVAGLPVLGDPYNQSVTEVVEALAETVMDLKRLKNGIYLGFDQAHRLPSRHGLRDIWDLPHINITKHFDQNDAAGQVATPAGSNTTTSTVSMGLWDAGNMFVSQALEVVQNAVPLTESGVDFKAWSAYRYVLGNGLDAIWPAYLESLDALVQVVVADGRQVYTIQLIVVWLEGGLVLLASVAYMWWAVQKFVGTRYALYNVFLQLPLGLTRTLANMSVVLEPGQEDEDDVPLGMDPAAAAAAAVAGGGGAGAAHQDDDDARSAVVPDNRSLRIDTAFKTVGSKRGGGFADGAMVPEGAASSATNLGQRLMSVTEANRKGAGPGSQLLKGASGDMKTQNSMTAKAAAAELEQPANTGNVLTRIASFWRGNGKVHSLVQSRRSRRRQLMPSSRMALLLVLPFVVWGIVLVAVNVGGFEELSGNDGLIASLAVMHTVEVRLNRMLFYSMDLAASFGTPTAEGTRLKLRHEMEDASLEYAVLLFGYEVLATGANHSRAISPHFSLAPEGIVNRRGQVTNKLYKFHSCMARRPEKCQAPDSPYHEVTHNGLDVLVKAHFLAVESLLTQNPPNASGGLNSTEFRFLWSTFKTDMEGGLESLIDMYMAHVQHAYFSLRIEQVILFVTGWAWAFIVTVLVVRPFLRRARLEMRRIAELLSQLPPEVDVESIVAQVVMNGANKNNQVGPAPPALVAGV